MARVCPFTKVECVFYKGAVSQKHPGRRIRSQDKLDEFAIAYMQSLIASNRVDRNSQKWREGLAKEAYEMANIMMQERCAEEEE